MEFAPLAFLGALVYKIIDFFKYVRARDWNGAGTQAITWLGGILAISLFAHSDFAAGIDLGGRSLGSLNFASQVIVGMSATSLFSAFYDVKKAIDGSDSARTTPLLMTSNPTPKQDPAV